MILLNLQGLNSILSKIAFLYFITLITSCSKNDFVNVVYDINEYHDNGFHVTPIPYSMLFDSEHVVMIGFLTVFDNFSSDEEEEHQSDFLCAILQTSFA